jgi:rhamnosyltransferase
MKENIVAILMATYNGSKYIEEQLDSIFKQTYTDWHLYISDDMSSDDTVDIIRRYMETEPRIVEIITKPDEHGAFKNFYYLIRHIKCDLDVDYDYYFYCDQDDIWLPSKIEETVIFANSLELDNCPMMIYSNIEYIDGYGNSVNCLASDLVNIRKGETYNVFFSHKYILGNTIAINKKLWSIMNIPLEWTYEYEKGLPHDATTAKYALIYGKVKYFNNILVKYRRHDNNVSMLPEKYSFVKGVYKFFTKFLLTITGRAYIYLGSLRLLCNLPDEDKTSVSKELEKCFIHGGIVALEFIKKYNISPDDQIYAKFFFMLIFLTGIYKHNKRFKSFVRNQGEC